ncbi:multidrug efflux system, subunit C [uncultured Alphaproteobacteria bacterium]|uniref:Multidrug efflux system, subunit C n=1 Tax=uncultured Alphaproteobacteria bacterium TaxID=91750 RepID=A0A212KMW1_9PROT|nr:multidrug efflux system, subunit C [uncultured Alphaproteobacteria bacterium]
MTVEIFIRRPVATTLLMVALILFGVIGYLRMPVSELPAVDFPTISVTASLPGTDPETMASAVATPLENQFSTIAGIDSMTSVSSQGQTRVTIQFGLDRNIDAAAQDVQAAISSATRKLPSDMDTPPTLRKVNPGDSPIFYIFMNSPTEPMSKVTQFAEGQLARRLSTVAGVAQVNVYGSQKYAVRLRMDPDAMAARGIGIDEVAAAVSEANVNQGTGSLSGPTRTALIHTRGQLLSADAYVDQVVAYRNGAPVRFGDLGEVVDSVENDRLGSWVGDTRTVILAVQRQPGSNTIEVVDAIRDILPTFEAQLPPSMNLSIFYDRSETIRESIWDVQFTLVLAALLVVGVIFVFLRSATATLIPSLALPISIIGTFAGMSAFGFSLDNLSLMALTLSVGFVVDDAIVMLENIVRHREAGERPFEAAIKGAKEIAFTIVSMTVSLAAVFIPVMFMGGIVGRLLHEFALTIVIAILMSGLVSLTLTPMLCSRMIKAGHQTHGRWYRRSERAFDALQSGYARSLDWCLAHKGATFAIFLASLGLSGWLFAVVPKDFLPSDDTGRLFGYTEGTTGASFTEMVRNQKLAMEIVRRDPDVAEVMSTVGAGGSRTTVNSGLLIINLKPLSERTSGADQIVRRLRAATANKIPGLNVYMQNPPIIRIGGSVSKAPYQYTLQDLDLDALYGGAERLTAALAKEPGFTDVTNDMDISAPTISVRVDRERAAQLGVTVRQIEDALASAFGQRQVSTMYTPSDQYEVILELLPRFQEEASSLERLYVRSTFGALVPLTAVTRIDRGVLPQTVNHLGQLPAVTVAFNLADGFSLGEAVARIDRLKTDAGIADTTQTSFQGTAQAFEKSTRGLGLLLLLAVAVVYIVLGILYESFVHPLTILSGLPSAAVGALLTLLIFDVPLSLYAFVGIIMLVGIVKKNAIMMIDFALEQERKENLPPETAIAKAALVRFRPIMMTTMAALMGTLPIAVGFGAGATARQPLGLTVVGGLILSQALTLYITPVLYILLDRALHRRPGKPVRA